MMVIMKLCKTLHSAFDNVAAALGRKMGEGHSVFHTRSQCAWNIALGFVMPVLRCGVTEPGEISEIMFPSLGEHISKFFLVKGFIKKNKLERNIMKLGPAFPRTSFHMST
jgi:hypothetical protein